MGVGEELMEIGDHHKTQHIPMAAGGLHMHFAKQEMDPSSHPLHSNSLPKEDQDLFLRAHFSAATPPMCSVNTAVVSLSSAAAMVAPSLIAVTTGDHPPPNISRTDESTPHQQRYESGDKTSSFLPALTQLPTAAAVQAMPTSKSGHAPTAETTPLPPPPSHTHTSSSLVEFASQQQQMEQQQQDLVMSLHDVTRVTNSVQAPISSLTPLPNDVLTAEEKLQDSSASPDVLTTSSSSAVAAPSAKNTSKLAS